MKQIILSLLALTLLLANSTKAVEYELDKGSISAIIINLAMLWLKGSYL